MINVLIVDDSAVIRKVLQEIFSTDPEIHVVGTAADPFIARDKIKTLNPDVITLDVEMPRMDGITFLRKIMSSRPTPIVICSSLTEKGADITLQALSAGAVEVIAKPTSNLRDFLQISAKDLVGAIRSAAGARVKTVADRTSSNNAPAVRKPSEKLDASVLIPHTVSGLTNQRTTEKIVLIGTSTGGTQALEIVLRELPSNAPAIAIVQHMPEKFTRSFAERLDSLCNIRVQEAKDGDRMLPGLALIAPGGKHMLIKRNGGQYHVEVKDGPLVCRHRPSVDVLFRSGAIQASKNALGIIMTGMGDDGARGLKELHDSGATTFAQDEESCVVFGMPKEAIKLGGVDQIVSLTAIPSVISNWR